MTILAQGLRFAGNSEVDQRRPKPGAALHHPRLVADRIGWEYAPRLLALLITTAIRAKHGLWLRPFVTIVPNGDATLTQTVGVLPGREITFSGWSKWEMNYSGGQALSPTNTLMQMEFLDAGNAVIGAPITLDLRTEQMTDNMWRQHSLVGIAPLGVASVRVSAIADNMFTTLGAQSAFFDDFSVVSVPEPTCIMIGLIGVVGLLGVVRRR